MANEFASQKYVDHAIVDGEGKKVGDIRVKPSGILWSKKGAHGWKRVTLEEFAAFMEQHGADQDK